MHYLKTSQQSLITNLAHQILFNPQRGKLSAPSWAGSSIFDPWCRLWLSRLEEVPCPLFTLRRMLTLSPAACNAAAKCVVTSHMNGPIDDCGESSSRAPAPTTERAGQCDRVPSMPWDKKQNAAHKRRVCVCVPACAHWGPLLSSVCTQLPTAAGEHLALAGAKAVPGGCKLNGLTWMNTQAAEQRGSILSGGESWL